MLVQTTQSRASARGCQRCGVVAAAANEFVMSVRERVSRLMLCLFVIVIWWLYCVNVRPPR